MIILLKIKYYLFSVSSLLGYTGNITKVIKCIKMTYDVLAYFRMRHTHTLSLSQNFIDNSFDIKRNQEI